MCNIPNTKNHNQSADLTPLLTTMRYTNIFYLSYLIRVQAPTDPVALHTPLRVLLLVARHADPLLVPRDEALVADRLLTHLAAETLLVPLLTLVLILLHA